MNSWNWTARFTVGALLALLFGAVQLNWFGLLPAASQELSVQAALLTLIGLFALRISPVGMAFGLAAAFVVIFIDQATAGIGITPLRFTPPSDFWTVNLTRVVVTWAAFPLLAWLIGRLVPSVAGGIAVAIALIPLPFIRYDNPAATLAALLDPGPGRYVVLTVPWLALCAAVALVATVAVLVTERRATGARPLFAVLAAVTLLVPLAIAAITTQQAAIGLAIEPPSGGPLTEVQVRATFVDAGTPIFAVDGKRVIRNQFLAPLRTGVTADARATFLPGAADALSAGARAVTVQLGAERRSSNYRLVPPGGVSLTLDPDRHVVVVGRPGAGLRLLVDGADGPELVDVSFDPAGSWRSPLPLPDGVFRVIAQSDEAWAVLDQR
ncbi:MAG: hypothetical protein M3Z65_10130 [Chloroflexota bacterium]|nr:hypothetical protein [Chloroflexota bacterium]